MTLKQESYDPEFRVVTRWVPGITSATRRFDDALQTDVLDLTFADGTLETVPIHGNTGLYLCNDAGKTMDVLSRFDRSKGAK